MMITVYPGANAIRDAIILRKVGQSERPQNEMVKHWKPREGGRHAPATVWGDMSPDCRM